MPRAVLRIGACAKKYNAQLFIISAGLGLVRAERPVPAYDLTLSEDAPESVRDQVAGGFESSRWWAAVLESRFSESAHSFPDGNGRILIALSRSYAAMVASWLVSLDDDTVARIRVFGSGLAKSLPPKLAKQYIDYDLRLDTIHPGTRHDFASRALSHFADLVAASPKGSVTADQHRVDDAMSGTVVRERAARDRMADEELQPLIATLARADLTVSQALNRLRSNFGIACGENRFRRIFDEVTS